MPGTPTALQLYIKKKRNNPVDIDGYIYFSSKINENASNIVRAAIRITILERMYAQLRSLTHFNETNNLDIFLDIFETDIVQRKGEYS